MNAGFLFVAQDGPPFASGFTRSFLIHPMPSVPGPRFSGSTWNHSPSHLRTFQREPGSTSPSTLNSLPGPVRSDVFAPVTRTIQNPEGARFGAGAAEIGTGTLATSATA